MSGNETYNGGCFCGKVQFTLTGAPVLMAYCHCDSCRHWSAGPVSAFTLWQPEDMDVMHGEDYISGYNKAAESGRKWCRSCGGHLFTDHSEMALIDVPAAVVSGFLFKPALHVNYQETVLHIRDGLPKMKDLPQEAGGSGELLAE